jgi:signal transduction histidine kinase
MEEDCLIVSVQANGRGIDSRDHQKVFERFQQVGNQFGGEIWVASELNKGATFTFRIPAASDPETNSE